MTTSAKRTLQRYLPELDGVGRITTVNGAEIGIINSSVIPTAKPVQQYPGMI